jgi:hypothetical protein
MAAKQDANFRGNSNILTKNFVLSVDIKRAYKSKKISLLKPNVVYKDEIGLIALS